VRIEPETYVPASIDADLATVRAFVPPVPVQPLFLDLPLMTGEEVEHAPHIAAASQPWPGSVALYSAPGDAGYALNSLLSARSMMGLTQNNLLSARPGLWDRGDALEVKLIAGTLASVSDTALLSGANFAAIGDGSSDNWELFQFSEAQLIAPQTYQLSRRLRGQFGTDALMPNDWPAGSWFVLLNGVPSQIDLRASLRRVAQHYRIGPAARSVDDPSYTCMVQACDGVGLRPYAPVHLRRRVEAGGHRFDWIRRTRLEGDSWEGEEVPLGEENESYRIWVKNGLQVLRTVDAASPTWLYTAAMQAADGPYTHVEVAQISARFGPGLTARVAA